MFEYIKRSNALSNYLIVILLILLLGCSEDTDSITNNEEGQRTVVNHYGNLSIKENNLSDQNGNTVTLRGMSLFWSQWGAQYYNKETIKWLRDDWKCTIIRAAMGIESGGYLENSGLELQKIRAVIDACIDLGIYVIVDWHDHHAEEHQESAVEFFNTISLEYGDYPNIIYEIYNEPLDVDWKEVLVPYSQNIIDVIRKNDPDNLIIVGTPNWSQDFDAIIGNEIDDQNTAYSLHFYSGTHREWLRQKAENAMNNSIPLFISEWGLSESDGDGEIDFDETNKWITFLENYDLSWCNWSIINKDETSAALLPSNTKLSDWSEEELSESGKIIRDYLIRMNSEIFNDLQD